MKTRQKRQRVIILIFLIGMSALIYMMMIQPSVKTESIPYTLGEEVSLQAKTYLNHVSDTDTVTIDKTQFQVQEAGEKQVTVMYRNKLYKVSVKITVPQIADLIKVTNWTQAFTVGGDYRSVFGIDERYANAVSYSVPSEQLKLGEQTVTATLYGQSVSQKLYVYDADNDIGKLTKAYDYKNKDLASVVQDYLTDEKIKPEQVAFSYQNLVSGKIIQHHENEAVTTGNTSILPVAMVVEDEMKKRGYDSTLVVAGVYVETLFEQAISASSSQSAIVLTSYFGGMATFYQSKINAYGSNNAATVKTIEPTTDQTTSNYFMQVLSYLWKNKDKYPLVTKYLESATPKRFYEMYLHYVNIWHNFGVSSNVINDVAIVQERNPYAVALYTTGLSEYQFGKLAYVINEWHRINQDK